jgi:phosphoribosylglycinamide formyltransferase 2
MLDGAALRAVVETERPDLIVPEVEAIATPMLVELEQEGWRVVPTARAARLTMDREGIRTLAAEELGLRTSPYRFAGDTEGFRAAVSEIGLPCVVKPVMSSSGRGQSIVRSLVDADGAWQHALGNARGSSARAIVEGFVEFDYEITLLTVRHSGGTAFCEPIGHLQIDGDYQESWQPQPMAGKTLMQAKNMAKQVTDALGGTGIFGVEFFVKDEDVYFSEISPRPHDTGMVTLISQDLSEFALHARAILGLPVPQITQLGACASCAILVEGQSSNPRFSGLDEALQEPGTSLRLFGKPSVSGHRRMGVALAAGTDIGDARRKARRVAASVRPTL